MPATTTVRITTADGGWAIPVTCDNCSGVVGVNILDAGAPLNINPPASLPLPSGASTAARQDTGNASLSSIDGKTPALASGRVPVDGSGVTQPVSISSMPSTPVTGPVTDTQLRASVVPVYVDGGTITATQGTTPWVVSGPLSDTQLRANVVPVYVDGGTLNVTQGTSPWVISASNLDVALSTRTKPADQQHVIIDTIPSTAVTGPLTDTQLRASAVPVSGTVSLSSTPLPTGAATDSTLSQLLDGGVLARGLTPGGQGVAVAVTPAGAVYVVTSPSQPLNPFLARCNAVRRFNCQP